MFLAAVLDTILPKSRKAALAELLLLVAAYIYFGGIADAASIFLSGLPGEAPSAWLWVRIVVSGVFMVALSIVFTILQMNARHTESAQSVQIETLANLGRDPGSPKIAMRSDDPIPTSSIDRRSDINK